MRKIGISVTFIIMCYSLVAKDSDYLFEQKIIRNTIKGSMGVEYINEDHSSVNGKTYIGRIPISSTTFLFEHPDYEILKIYSKYVDKDMYDDLIERNKSSIVIDSTGYDEYIIHFMDKEQTKLFQDHKLDEETQNKILFEIVGNTSVTISSRPGFNKSRTLALVNILNMYPVPCTFGPPYAMHGYYKIYQKKEEEWEFVDMIIFF